MSILKLQAELTDRLVAADFPDAERAGEVQKYQDGYSPAVSGQVLAVQRWIRRFAP